MRGINVCLFKVKNQSMLSKLFRQAVSYFKMLIFINRIPLTLCKLALLNRPAKLYLTDCLTGQNLRTFYKLAKKT